MHLWLSATAVLALPLLSATGFAHETHGHGAHEHGVGELTLVVDEGGRIHLEFESPMINLIGFEHRPRSDAQRATLQAAVRDLREGVLLFSFSPVGAACGLRDATLLSALVDDEEEVDDGHADIFVAWRFECRSGVLREIDARGFFDRFPGTERLRIQAVTDRGQTARELTPSSSRIGW